MARDFSARADIDSSNLVDFPDGRLRNSSPPASRNGTAVVEEVYGDLQQFFLKLLRDASITPNGNADTDSVSQYLLGLIAKIRETTASTTQNGTVELATDAEVNAGTTGRVVTADGLDQRQATTTLSGLIEVATNTEVNSGVDSERAITPSGLNQRTATTSRTGIIELATTTEVNNGTDASRAVTPNGLAGRTATESRTGIAAIATQAEVNAGTVDTDFVTPLKLATTPSVVGSDASTKVRVQAVSIGTWNIFAGTFRTVTHGITDWTDIISITGVIRNDANTLRYTLGPRYNGSSPVDIGIESFNSTTVRLSRTEGGLFTNASFSSTSFSRGTLYITYQS